MPFGRRARSLAASLGVTFLAFAGCTFPDFVSVPAASPPAGTGGAPLAGSGGRGGSGPPPVFAGGGGQLSVGGNTPEGGVTSMAGEAGMGGSKEDPPACTPLTQVAHCLDGKTNLGETDIDCGGAECEPCAADELCTEASDCSTGDCSDGRCERLLSLRYQQLKPDDASSEVRMLLSVEHEGKEAILLRDLSIRYYFSRNTVSEPILPEESVSDATKYPSGITLTKDFRLRVVRLLRSDGLKTDAYLDLGFVDGALVPADSLVLKAGLAPAEGKFAQRTHYSFDVAAFDHETKHIAIYLKGVRIWGRAPALPEPASCFFSGVNLDGGPLAVGNQTWLDDVDVTLEDPGSSLGRYFNSTSSLEPATDKGTEEMLRAGFRLQDAGFSYPLANGRYAMVAYAWSVEKPFMAGTLILQTEKRDVFYPKTYHDGFAWAPLGPYEVKVTGGRLDVKVAGFMNLGGFELQRLAP